MTICNIVVAYYNNHNFRNLLKLFEKKFFYTHKIIIYNKSGSDIILNNNIIQKHLDNVG